MKCEIVRIRLYFQPSVNPKVSFLRPFSFENGENAHVQAMVKMIGMPLDFTGQNMWRFDIDSFYGDNYEGVVLYPDVMWYTHPLP